MKWGRKKPHSSSAASSSSSSSSSSLPQCSKPSSLISHVFPVSWLSKFKHKSTTAKPRNPKTPTLQNLASAPLQNPNPNLPRCPSLTGKFYSFEDDDGDAFWRLSFGQDTAGVKSTKRVVGLKPPPVWTHHGGLGLGRVGEEDLCGDKTSFDLQSLREMDAKKKSDQGLQRKSVHVSNRVRSPKACSPRPDTCKVKALEDMKRAKKRTRMKKKKKKKKKSLDSFAVVKSSYDPEKDFKESMVEMILEKKMSRADELEELLACYLTLNSDECHGLIIKVFREVWLELDELDKNQQLVFSH